MENLCHRFPHVAKIILNNLDDQSLIQIMEANREVDYFLSNNRIYWIRVLANYNTNFIQFRDSWRRNIHRVPVVKIKELVIATQNFFKNHPSRLNSQWSPLDIAAHSGCLEFYKYISGKCGCINHVRDDGTTSIHMAANAGHLEILKFILNNLPDQDPSAAILPLIFSEQRHNNPENSNGLTPLHYAALNGHFETCTFIIKLLTNKNPRDKRGITPLHCAAQEGHVRICKLIMEYLEDKNPANNIGWTPLHLASSYGQLEPIKLIMCQVQNKNPEEYTHGYTPLQVAIIIGQLKVVKLFIGNLDVKILGDSFTSLHSAARCGDLPLCKLLIKNSNHKNYTDKNGWTPLHYAAINGHFAICELLSEYFVEKPSFNKVWTLLGYEIAKSLKYLGPKTNHGVTPLKLLELNFSHIKEFLKYAYDTGNLNRTGSLEGTLGNPSMRLPIVQKSHDHLALSFQQSIGANFTTVRKILGFRICQRTVQSLVAPYFPAVMHQLIYQLVHVFQ
jgi:ankyrin repeat protein